MSRSRNWLGVGALLLACLLPQWGVGQSAPETAAPSAAPAKQKGPKLIYSVDPEYTDLARKKRVQGSCEFSLKVGVDGKPHDVVLTKSVADGQPEKLRTAAMSLDDKGVEAVQQYRFEPAMRNGEPVEASIHMSVNFQLF